MRTLVLLLMSLTMIVSGSAHAGQAEVRDVAISNNCPPKKIEVYQQALGAGSDTIYRVQCTMPKTVGAAAEGAAKPADALLISCKQNLCEMLRPVSADKK